MKHPLEFVPSEKRKPIFLAFFAWFVLIAVIMQIVSAPLKTSAASAGIVSYELAGTAAKAGDILASWNQTQMFYAAFGLGLDYLLMPSYALALSLGILLAMGRHKSWFASLGIWLGWGSFAAALFDATENFALWRILLGEFQSVWPMVAAFCAMVKFTLLIVGLVYAVVGGIWPKSR